MLELKVFQSEAANLIANRYAFFANHADRPRRGNKPRPFFQALSALTGAGKTPILAQAVALVRGFFAAEPIILWMSKAKSVVAQTYTNFSTGGKYSEIIDGFRVITTPSLAPQLISDGSIPLIVMTTTGLFNNKDQSEGNLNIYQTDNDLFGEKSPWQRLIERQHQGKRRPLIIVYDEGHNLSEQQTEILSELEPDAYLLASATLPQPLQRRILYPIAFRGRHRSLLPGFHRLEKQEHLLLRHEGRSSAFRCCCQKAVRHPRGRQDQTACSVHHRGQADSVAREGR